MRENRVYGFSVNKRSIGLYSKLMVFIVMLLGLSSCAVYENKFDCPPGKGAHCSSVEEIEQMVNNGGVWKVNFYEFDDGIRSESNRKSRPAILTIQSGNRHDRAIIRSKREISAVCRF